MFTLKHLPDAAILEKFAARYPDADIAAVLGFLNILRIGSDLSDALDGFLDRFGLLQGRWWVLILLMREDNLSSSPSALAEKSGVSRATMTGLLDGLERDGLVQRINDSSDRRKYAIRLTEQGQRKLDEIMPDYYRRVRALMSVLPAARYESLLGDLQALRDNIGMLD